MAPFEALYGRPCKSPACWIEPGDRLVLGPDMIMEASEKVNEIRRKMKTAQDRQKSYADRRRRELKFQVGDEVFLKVSPLKNVIRFGRRGKLAPRFVGPFTITERIGTLAYRVALPEKFEGVHNVFHVSHLRKVVHDPSMTIPIAQLDEVDIEPDLTIERRPLRIVDRDTKQLRRKTVSLVKVQWSPDDRDCTWETEESIRDSNPELFVEGKFHSIFFTLFDNLFYIYRTSFIVLPLFPCSFSGTKSFE